MFNISGKNQTNMNKSELIIKIAEDAGISKDQATSALNSFISTVTKTLKEGGKVTIPGLGSFSVSKRAARFGRNPNTGSTVKINPRKIAKFKPSKNLSSILSGGTDHTGPRLK